VRPTAPGRDDYLIVNVTFDPIDHRDREKRPSQRPMARTSSAAIVADLHTVIDIQERLEQVRGSQCARAPVRRRRSAVIVDVFGR
jgi:hypothetical protein